jgi:hypothetical protein
MRHRVTTSKSAPGPSVQGTLGGPAPAVGSKPGRRQMVMGDEIYLWILVAIEVATIGWLRSAFSRYHGG